MKYIVVKGDTLSEVAKRFGTTVKAIQKANPTITDANKIYIGMTLEIPMKHSEHSPDYEALGRAFQRALNDISKLDSVKALLKMYW